MNYLPKPKQHTIFTATASVANGHFQIWHKPKTGAMLMMVLYGAGGNGGAGAIGANSVAAGGGGGGSGGMSKLLIPLSMIPDVLYLQVPLGGSAISAAVSLIPNVNTAQYLVLQASSGGNGGPAAGATAGAGGTAAGIVAIANCNIAGRGIPFFLAGIVGTTGGTTGNGTNATYPSTGSPLCQGTGGAGLGAAAAAGSNGGNLTGLSVTNTNLVLQTLAGGQGPGAGAATTPPTNGQHGLIINDYFNYGGTGGGSTHGTATGAGLVQASGGSGSIGCGGGGSGGALTGSTPGAAGRGGDGQIMFWVY